MTTRKEAPASPEPEPDPEECPDNQAPLFLLGPDELPYLLHPTYCVRYREDGPAADPGVEYLLIRNEDYRESDDEDWAYGGLVPKMKLRSEWDDDVSPEQQAEYRRTEPEEWFTPESFPCPKCGGKASRSRWEDGDEDFRPYDCETCGWILALESRSYIANAAVLLIYKEPPYQG